MPDISELSSSSSSSSFFCSSISFPGEYIKGSTSSHPGVPIPKEENKGRVRGEGSKKVKMLCCVWEGKVWNKWEGMEEGWEAIRLRWCVCGRGSCGTNGKGWRKDGKQEG